MTIGTEHEYSINGADFRVCSVSDEILREACGSYQSDILFGNVVLSKELQKTVIEFIPHHPTDNLCDLEKQLIFGMNRFNHFFGSRYKLLGLGMHPTARLDDICVWNHDDLEIYEAYNKLFNLHQHGWLNIQSLQINLSYSTERNLVEQYNKIRALLPYLIAITASSPMVEGRMTGICDNRLVYYRDNQKEIPEICGGIIPEKIKSISDYNNTQKTIYERLESNNAGILCSEWLNSSGLIIRPSRKCLEIKALDEQECIRSDMAVCAFVRALLRCELSLERDREMLLNMMEEAIRDGTLGFKKELEKMYVSAWNHSTEEEKFYLPIVWDRIERGSLAERIKAKGMDLGKMAESLRTNVPYGSDVE